MVEDKFGITEMLKNILEKAEPKAQNKEIDPVVLGIGKFKIY